MLMRLSFLFICIGVLTNYVVLASDPTEIQKYGHHVSVRAEGEHFCSGSIVSSRFILTSQWCLFLRTVDDDITIVAGTKSLDISGDSYKIDKILTIDIYNDIALLRTQKEIIFHNDVRKIPIASHLDFNDDYELSITGWEQPPSGEKRRSEILQQFSVLLYDKNMCNETSGSDGYMCIYEPNGKQVCSAEKGAAIVADGHQIGIYTQESESYDITYGSKQTSLHPYMQWIQENIELEEDTTPPAKKFEYDATPGAYPYQVSIRHNNEHICSGSIIHKRHILTSINCIMRCTPKTLTVMVGISSLNEIGDTYQVEKVEGHPGYRYDIAIIKLATEITFKNHVKPIPIVKSGKKYGDSENIMLTGWQRKNSCGPSNNKLQQIPFHTVETKKCKQFIPFLNPGYMCSMAEYEDICNIDYGGPIVSNGIQIALNPYDVECGGQFQPQLHVPLYKVATWIKLNCRS